MDNAVPITRMDNTINTEVFRVSKLYRVIYDLNLHLVIISAIFRILYKYKFNSQNLNFRNNSSVLICTSGIKTADVIVQMLIGIYSIVVLYNMS